MKVLAATLTLLVSASGQKLASAAQDNERLRRRMSQMGHCLRSASPHLTNDKSKDHLLRLPHNRIADAARQALLADATRQRREAQIAAESSAPRTIIVR